MDTGVLNLGVLNIDFNPYWVSINIFIKSEPKLRRRSPTMGGLTYSSFPPWEGESLLYSRFSVGKLLWGKTAIQHCSRNDLYHSFIEPYCSEIEPSLATGVVVRFREIKMKGRKS